MQASKRGRWSLIAAAAPALAAACTSFGASPPVAPDAAAVDGAVDQPEDGGVVVLDAATQPDACEGPCVTACAPGEKSYWLAPTKVSSKSTGPFLTVPEGSEIVSVIDEGGEGDGDTSYVECTDPGGTPEEIRFELEDSEVPDTERITRVFVRARARRLSEGKPGTGLALGVRHGPTAASVLGDVNPVATSYAVHTLELTVYPFAGVGRPWVGGDFGPARLVLAFASADANNPVRVTQAWMEVCTVPET